MEQKIIVLAGPSGVGKTTAKEYLLGEYPELEFSVSTTTRLKTAHEVDGRDYNFVSFRDFESKVAAGEFAEWQQVYSSVDSCYGTTNAELERIFSGERSPLLDIDVHGALNVKRIYGDRAFIIMVKPPSIAELERRLLARKRGETETKLRERLAKAESELQFADRFDAAVVNDGLDDFLAELVRVVGKAIGTGTHIPAST